MNLKIVFRDFFIDLGELEGVGRGCFFLFGRLSYCLCLVGKNREFGWNREFGISVIFFGVSRINSFIVGFGKWR